MLQKASAQCAGAFRVGAVSGTRRRGNRRPEPGFLTDTARLPKVRVTA